MVRTVEWDDESVVLIDQRRLPHEESYLRCRQPAEVAAAIRDMAVRGAPAIGVSAAFGVALGARRSPAEGAALRRDFEAVCEQLRATRPTAVNLFWAIERMRRRFAQAEPRARAAVREGAAGRSAGHPRGRRCRLPPHGRPGRRADPRPLARAHPLQRRARWRPAATARRWA